MNKFKGEVFYRNQAFLFENEARTYQLIYSSVFFLKEREKR
jgi:hypothetical protein